MKYFKIFFWIRNEWRSNIFILNSVEVFRARTLSDVEEYAKHVVDDCANLGTFDILEVGLEDIENVGGALE